MTHRPLRPKPPLFTPDSHGGPITIPAGALGLHDALKVRIEVKGGKPAIKNARVKRRKK
jgi:hypothetical protein